MKSVNRAECEHEYAAEQELAFIDKATAWSRHDRSYRAQTSTFRLWGAHIVRYADLLKAVHHGVNAIPS